MKIQILGTGCPKCKKVVENTGKAVDMSGIDAEIVKVERINDLVVSVVMMTPALAIDGDVKISGKIPSPEQIAEWIKESA